MLTFVSKSAHVCDPVLTIVTDEPLSAADARVNRTTPLLTNVSNAARWERGDVSLFSGAQHLLYILIGARNRVLPTKSTALNKCAMVPKHWLKTVQIPVQRPIA